VFGVASVFFSMEINMCWMASVVCREEYYVLDGLCSFALEMIVFGMASIVFPLKLLCLGIASVVVPLKLLCLVCGLLFFSGTSRVWDGLC